MKQVTAKLGNMKKAVDWVVYPAYKNTGSIVWDNNLILHIQSAHRFAAINTGTKKCILSRHVANYPMQLHLHASLGAIKIEVTQEFIDECLAAQPKSGDQMVAGQPVFFA